MTSHRGAPGRRRSITCAQREPASCRVKLTSQKNAEKVIAAAARWQLLSEPAICLTCVQMLSAWEFTCLTMTWWTLAACDFMAPRSRTC